MQKRHLIIFAGCNGSGKSTFSKTFVDKEINPFDYDKQFLKYYNELRDSELRENFAKLKTDDELNRKMDYSFDNLLPFSFETNLHIFPFKIVQRAKDLNYLVIVIFFCLENLDIAKNRVEIRTKNDDHFVSDETIEYKWKEGYKNLNANFKLFDNLVFVDNSIEAKAPTVLFEMNKLEQDNFELRLVSKQLPEYTERRFPAIFNLIS